MIKNTTVDVWNNATGAKTNGIFIPGTLAKTKSIDVDIQPYSKELLLRNYGYNIEVNKRIYIDHFDSDIKIGTILKYTDKYGAAINLEVKAIPWDDKYMEVFGLAI